MEHYDIQYPTLYVGTGTRASTSEVRKYLDQNPERLDAFKKDPYGQLDAVVKEAGKPAYFADKWIYRYVAIALGVTLVLAVIGAIILAWWDKSTPDVLVAFGSAAVGALAGLFAPRSSS